MIIQRLTSKEKGTITVPFKRSNYFIKLSSRFTKHARASALAYESQRYEVDAL